MPLVAAPLLVPTCLTTCPLSGQTNPGFFAGWGGLRLLGSATAAEGFEVLIAGFAGLTAAGGLLGSCAATETWRRWLVPGIYSFCPTCRRVGSSIRFRRASSASGISYARAIR